MTTILILLVAVNLAATLVLLQRTKTPRDLPTISIPTQQGRP